MNIITILVAICSSLYYLLFIQFLWKHPKKVFPTMVIEFFESLNQIKPKEWSPNVDNYLWNYFQEHSIKILANKKMYLFKIIFLEGGAILFIWFLITVQLVYPKDWGLKNFIPEDIFIYFLLGQIVVLFSFYFFHLRRFKTYLIMGEKEKLLTELKQIKYEDI